MAAKKKEQETNDSSKIELGSKEFFNELIKDTDFVKCDEGSLMNNRPKVLTPLYVLNCITGGGLPLAIQEEVSGVPASGKSTFCYSMLGTFQKQYGDNGVGVILDLEGSTDDTRLKQLGIDSSKVLRLPAVSIESAFENMFKMFKKLIDMKEKTGKDIKLFIIFDSLSAGGIQAQHDSIENGGTAMTFGSGMMALPRILKQNMANVTPFLEKIDASVHYINQVFMQGIGTYAPRTGSGGGFGKDHMMDLISPKGKEDMILIGCATEIAEEQKNLIKKAPIQVNENFIWAIRFNLNQFLVDFELEHPNSQLEKFLITEEIFEDGLSKNELIHTFKRIYKAKLQCLWLLEKTFGQKTINVDQL